MGGNTSDLRKNEKQVTKVEGITRDVHSSDQKDFISRLNNLRPIRIRTISEKQYIIETVPSSRSKDSVSITDDSHSNDKDVHSSDQKGFISWLFNLPAVRIKKRCEMQYIIDYGPSSGSTNPVSITDASHSNDKYVHSSDQKGFISSFINYPAIRLTTRPREQYIIETGPSSGSKNHVSITDDSHPNDKWQKMSEAAVVGKTVDDFYKSAGPDKEYHLIWNNCQHAVQRMVEDNVIN